VIQYDNRSWGAVLGRLSGSVYPTLVPRALLAAGIGGVAVLLHERYRIAVPVVVHSLIGVALGLLLVFRTNASYDRFWEGRKILGAMVNRTRDLARQVAAYVSDEDTARTLRRQVSAWYGLAGQTLQRKDALDALGPLLTAAERRALVPVAHRAPVMSAWISARLEGERRAGRLTDFQATAMDQNLTSLLDALGAAERILKTPIPFAYAQHIKVFVLTYVFTAPFALVEATGWFAPVAAAVLALALLGIEQIGVEIEDPFGDDPNDLPVTEIGAGIDRATTEMLEHRAP
jgi:putative membrane protein